MDDVDVRERLRRASAMVSPSPQDPLERLARRRERRKRRERLMAGGVAIALLIGLVGGTVAVLGHIGVRQGPTSGGRDGAMGRLGHRTGSVRALNDGSYVYRTETLTSQGYFTAGSTTLDHLGFTITTWWANDGSGRVGSVCLTPDCQSSYGFGPTGVFGPGGFPTDDDMTGLSTDPAALLVQLEARSADGGSSPEPAFSPGPELTPGVTVGTVLDAIVNILEDPNGSPELKAACFDVARSMPSVAETDGVTDPAGRPAVRLRFAMDTWSSVDYFFDPATHLLMAEDSGGVGSPDQRSTTIYNMGVVDSTDAEPTAGQWLFPPAPQPSPSPSR